MNIRTSLLHIFWPVSALVLTACPVPFDVGDNTDGEPASTSPGGGPTTADDRPTTSGGPSATSTGEPGSTETTISPESTGSAGTTSPGLTGNTDTTTTELTASTGSSGPESTASTGSSGETGDPASTGSSETTDAQSTDGTTGGIGDTEGTMTTGMFEGCLDVTDSDTAGDPSAWSWHAHVQSYDISPKSLVLDHTGAVLLSSQFIGQTDLGGGPRTAAKVGRFLVKYDGQGQYLWDDVSSGFKDSALFFPALAVDCAGNIYIAGSFVGTIEIDGELLTATEGIDPEGDPPLVSTDMVIAKLTPAGKLVWARRFGDDQNQVLNDVVTTPAGGIIVAGAVKGAFAIDGADIDAGAKNDGLLAEFDADGALVWHKTFGGAVNVLFRGLDHSPTGLLAVAGYAEDKVDFGGGPLAKIGNQGDFVAQFEPNGAHRWSVRALADHRWSDLAAGPDGKVYVTGTKETGVYDLFLSAYDPTGAVAWSIYGESNDFAWGQAVTTAPSGEVAVTGNFRGTLHLGGGALKDPQSSNLFVARFTAGGQLIKAAKFAGNALPQMLRFGPDGELVLGGLLQGTIDFGTGPLIPPGIDEIFLHRFSP